MKRCPCWTHDISGWPSKSFDRMTDAEAEHVRLLVHGEPKHTSHRPNAILGPPPPADPTTDVDSEGTVLP